MVSTIAGGGSPGGVASGYLDGTGSAALFYQPTGITVKLDGVLFVSDTGNHNIRMINTAGNQPMNFVLSCYKARV